MAFAWVCGIAALVAAHAAAQPLYPDVPFIWPMPRLWQKAGGGPRSLPDILREAIVRYRTLSFPFGAKRPRGALRRKDALPELDAAACSGDITAVTALQIYVTDVSEDLRLYVDESYTLTITDAAVGVLRAQTVYGALRGLESFSQLVMYTAADGSYRIPTVPLLIDDAPRFPWRGLLIDTSRHYLSVETIKRVLDGLAYNKFNVLHWHIIDAQSFPLQSRTYPLLSEMGAWAPDLIYTRQDMEDIVAYARFRGIRVMPELDTPGHSRSWGGRRRHGDLAGYGYPELLADCVKIDPWAPALDPLPNNTYEFIENLFRELTEIFPEEFWHFGGDEVNYGCWAQDAEIRQYILQERITLNELFRRYWFRLQDIVKVIGRRSVAWEEVFISNLNPPLDGVIQIWTNKTFLDAVVRAGYPALLSAGWYLDKQQPGGNDVRHYFILDTWRDFYDNEPVTSALTPEQEALILGGEGNLWGEQVDDLVMEERLWPRASAIAERLWSPKEVVRDDWTEKRLNRFRCTLAERGLRASPLNPSPPCLIPM